MRLNAVHAGPAPLLPKKLIKRLAFDIDGVLHRRIRNNCFDHGNDMAEHSHRLIAEHYRPK